MNFDSIETEKLLFRRQFILGQYFSNKFPSWQKTKIGRSLFLEAHPDLELAQINQDGIELTLMGYMIDPYNPQHGNHDILLELLSNIKKTNDIFKQTESLGGRWILILDNRDETILFNDATGLRQVFYTDHSFPQNYCASQPGIIAEEINLSFDKEAYYDFINSSWVKNSKEYWWPGDSSPFKEIKHLYPNHYLDLKKRKTFRFWPDKILDRIEIKEAVKKSSEILKGLMKGAANRFDLAFSITNGWDTRLLLAAGKEISHCLYYHTLIYYDLNEESPDIKIPSKLLSQLGLKHHIIKCTTHMDKEFKELYHKNVAGAHDAWGNIVQGLHNHYPKNRICVKGVISSEVVKDNYYKTMNFSSVNGYDLAASIGAKDNTFAIKHFEKWLSVSKEIAERYNINIFDLFGWEMITGNWQAMSQLESDIVYEIFSPYNCRKLLETLISVDIKYRKPPKHKLYYEIIKNQWKDILIVPINPISVKQKIKYILKDIMIRTGTYRFAQFR